MIILELSSINCCFLIFRLFTPNHHICRTDNMQVLDQPESFNLLNTLLFNLPSSPAYSSCAQYPAVPGLVSGCGPVGFISGPVSPIITHNLASSHQNSKTYHISL